MKKGFNTEKYIAAQTTEILKRIRNFGKLYLEIGGKLCYDKHAARVLPGYRETSKIEILKRLSTSIEHNFSDPSLKIIYCVSAKNLEKNRVVGLSKLDYKEKTLKDLGDLKKFGFKNIVVIITRFSKEKMAREFGISLRKLKYRVYFHNEIEGYGNNLAATLRGYEKNNYVKINKDLIVVTGPASGSGKMGFCLSQIYHERKNIASKNVPSIRQASTYTDKVGKFAKFESFPIWNLPMNHPINLAYEAATADLGDYNVIDTYHKKAYGKRAVNYNRDVNNFGILMGIAQRISGEKWPCGYRSPTDMGMNMMKVGIVDDLICREAAKIEIRKRLKNALRCGKKCKTETKRLEKISKKI